MKKTSYIKSILIITLSILATACSTMNSKVGGYFDLDTDVTLTIVIEDDVNPDDAKVSSPVILRLYELKSSKAFENANFIDLYERDIEVLGKTMITEQKLKALQPGEITTASFVLSKDTTYIGLYAEFLQYQDAKYKLVIPVAQMNLVDSTAKIQLTDNKMILLQ